MISVYLFTELISCSLHQFPLERKMGDNCASLLLHGSHYQLWIKWPWINELGPWRWTSLGGLVINWKSISVMDKRHGHQQHNPARFTLKERTPPPAHPESVGHCVTMKHAPAAPLLQPFPNTSPVSHREKTLVLPCKVFARKFSFALTVLQAYCCSFFFFFFFFFKWMLWWVCRVMNQGKEGLFS